MDCASHDALSAAFVARRTDILGPSVISTFLQGLQTGLIMILFTRFWSRADKESTWVKLIVLFVTAAAFFQTGSAFWTCWDIHVMRFPDLPAMLEMNWAQRGMFAIIICMSAPAQSFLAWRCWVVLGRRWIVLILLCLVILACVVSSVCATVFALLMPEQFTVQLMGPLEPLQPSYVIALVLPAVLDLIITAILLRFLIHHYHSVPTKRTRLVLSRLMIVAWEAAVPPSFCAIASVVMLIVYPSAPGWANMLQSVLGKLYVMALLFTLNSRADIAELYRGPGSYQRSFAPESLQFTIPWRYSEPRLRPAIQTPQRSQELVADIRSENRTSFFGRITLDYSPATVGAPQPSYELEDEKSPGLASSPV